MEAPWNQHGGNTQPERSHLGVFYELPWSYLGLVWEQDGSCGLLVLRPHSKPQDLLLLRWGEHYALHTPKVSPIFSFVIFHLFKFRKSGKSSLQGQRAYSPERQLVQLFGKRGFGVLCYGWKRDSSRRRRMSIFRRFPRLCHHTATTTILHGLFPASLVPPEKFSGATGDFLRHCCRFSPAAPEIFSQAAEEFWEERSSPRSAPWSAGSSISRLPTLVGDSWCRLSKFELYGLAIVNRRSFSVSWANIKTSLIPI